VFVAFPLALGFSALLLPGDPDDPNTKAFFLAMIVALPSWVIATLLGLVLGWRNPDRRGTLLLTLAPATVVAISGWLLLLAWPIAQAEPVPETKEQRLLAQGDPHLWAPGAWRMVAAAALLAVVGVLLARWTARPREQVAAQVPSEAACGPLG
jgi:protein-S-isoprenylcysteine O-methyltransferase Ste14